MRATWEYLCERRERLYVAIVLVVWSLAEAVADIAGYLVHG